MSEDIFTTYRPKTFKSVIGQDRVTKVLMKHIKDGTTPHALLFTGGSGRGKTTLARIMRTKLNCADRDFVEINASETRGIDMIRDIKKSLHMMPLAGKEGTRVYLIDECHKMTSDAQSALLKILEEPPRYVYIMLATTDPQKLSKTIQNRCTLINCEAIKPADLGTLVDSILEKEDREISKDVKSKLIQAADGSARKALVLLKSVMMLEDEEEQLDAIEKSNPERQAIEIARMLINNKTVWLELVPVLKSVDEEPETLRRMILGYCSSIMLSEKSNTFMLSRAYMLLVAFESHYFDSGKAGLIASCYEVVSKNGTKR